MKESTIQNKIRLWLEKQGYYVVKVIVANKKGVPDLIVCVNGKFVGLEVKTPKGTPSELQSYNLGKINECGGLAMIVRSVDDVKELFARHGLMKGDI